MTNDTSNFLEHFSRTPVQATLLVGAILYAGTLIEHLYVEMLVLWGYPLIALYAVFSHRPDLNAPSVADMVRDICIAEVTEHNPNLVLLLGTIAMATVMPFGYISIAAITVTAYYHLDHPRSQDALSDALETIRDELVDEGQTEVESDDDVDEHVLDDEIDTTPLEADTTEPTPPRTSDASERVDVLEYATPTGTTYRFVREGAGEELIDAHLDQAVRRRKLRNGVIGGLAAGIAFVSGNLLDALALSPDAALGLAVGAGVSTYLLAAKLNPARPNYGSRSATIAEFDDVPELKDRGVRRETAAHRYPDHKTGEQ